MNINRRQAIRSALFSVAALSQCKGLAALVLPQESSTVSIDPGVTLFQPLEENTIAVMDQYFPGYRTSPALQALLPYTAFIKNGGKSPVKAYRLKWVHKVGKVSTALYSTTFVSRPSAARRSAMATGWNTIIRPGEYAVVTPIFLWSATKYMRHGGDIPVEKLMAVRPRAASAISSADPTKIYRVRRDTKICRHTAIGHSSSMASKFESMVNLEREAAARLVVAAGASSGLLGAVSERLSSLGSIEPGNLEAQVKHRYLKSVQARAKFFGNDAAWTGVQQVASRPQLALEQRPWAHTYKSRG